MYSFEAKGLKDLASSYTITYKRIALNFVTNTVNPQKLGALKR